MGISLEVAQGVGSLFVGSMFYGLYLPSLFFCLRCLIWDDTHFRSPNTVHWIILTSALTLFTASTLHLSIGLLRSVRAFAQCTEPGASVHLFDSVSDWVNMIRSITTFVAIFVGDAILIYRCWIVWLRNYYIIILPLVLYFANLSCAIVITWKELTVEAHSLVAVEELKAWFLANTALTIPLNVITTSLIVYRIRKVDSENAKQRNYYSRGMRRRNPKSTALHSVMRIIIESGLLYTASAVISFIAYICNSNAFYVATSLEVQITGIAFNLIIIRTHRQSTHDSTIQPTRTSQSIQFNHPATQPDMTTNSIGDILTTEEHKESAQHIRLSEVGDHDES